MVVDSRLGTGNRSGDRPAETKAKWVTFRGSKQKAEAKLNELLTAANGGTFVEPSKMTLIAWLSEWLEAAIKPQCRPATYVRYHGIIENHISKATIADMPLQKLRPSHLEAYYAAATGSASTLTLHAGKIRIVQQLNTPGPEPTFGPPKNKRSRTVALGAETVTLLKAHKKHQSALKLANRPTYHGFRARLRQGIRRAPDAERPARATAAGEQPRGTVIRSVAQGGRGAAHQVPRLAAHVRHVLTARWGTSTRRGRTSGPFGRANRTEHERPCTAGYAAGRG